VDSISCNGTWQPPDTWPQELQDRIRRIPLHSSQDTDTLCWRGSANGQLTASMAWEQIRKQRPPAQWASLVWSSQLPPRVKILVWKVWQDRLPTDEWAKKTPSAWPRNASYARVLRKQRNTFY